MSSSRQPRAASVGTAAVAVIMDVAIRMLDAQSLRGLSRDVRNDLEVLVEVLDDAPGSFRYGGDE